MEQIVKPKKKEYVSDIEIIDTGDTGFGIGKKNGLVYFVKDALPGDVVTIQVKRIKSNVVESHLVSVDKESNLRVNPFCIHFDECGGCVWQALSYEAQLEQKHKKVIQSFEKIAKIPVPFAKRIKGCSQTTFYRNKMDFGFCNKKFIPYSEVFDKSIVSGKGLGFHVAGIFDKILDITSCHLQMEPSNEIRNFLRERTSHLEYYDFRTHEGMMRNLIIRNNSINELMIILAINNELDELFEILNELKDKFSEIKSIYYVINKKWNDSLGDQDHILFYGEKYITEIIDGVKFQYGPRSFFQTNNIQTPLLFSEAIALAGITKNDVIYDLYTGVGTLALMAANQGAKHIVGIEYVEEAIEFAKHNAELNGFENTTFFAGDMKKILNESFYKINGKPDIIITDPPRAGMDKEVCEVILEMEPKKIVYVSCNPGTQARDVAILSEKYELTYLQPVDMFPHTYHVENIVVLEKREVFLSNQTENTQENE